MYKRQDIHLISGEISIGKGKTVTLMVANFIPLAGQKSSKTFTKKVKTLEV